MNNSLNDKKDELIGKFVKNLPVIRAKMKMSQAELADLAGIGRQTLISIENGNSKMRWDTFLAMMLIVSKDPSANDFLELLDMKMEDLGVLIQDSIFSRHGAENSFQDKLWTTNNYRGDVTVRAIVPVPRGYVNGECPKCHSKNIRGALIMPTADEEDPNLMCMDCYYWWD